MLIITTATELKEVLVQFKEKKIGFVPTMGALHEGHISLIKKSKKISDITVCSIFVNPTQFNDQKDYEKYPITTDKDISLLELAHCDIVFLPAVQEIYPEGYTQKTNYQLGYLEEILEGKYRPGHFQGVCQVVDRLLHFVMPNYLIMGAKDYQQCMVIQHLLKSNTTISTVQLVIAPTIRESSGLAKSSRNMRLSSQDILNAITIYQSLQYINLHLQKGKTAPIIEKAVSILYNSGFEKVDYVAVADANTLELVEEWDGEKSVVILAAAFLNGIRLIDNIIMTK